MKPFKSLNLGFLDAENYLERDNKSFFNEIFLKDENLDKLLRSSTYFLIGEKGTGKTAYSVFLSNGEYKKTKSTIKYIRETDYTKFIELKKQKNLGLSDFSSIWKVILLVLISKQIKNQDLKANFIERKYKIESLVRIIDDYYENAFSPEIINALNIVENDELMALLKKLDEGEAWDYYFPWSRPSTNESVREEDPSFISFLRLSYSRPRDLIASLQILQDEDKLSDIFYRGKAREFFFSNDFKERLSEYILRSIKNQTSFYYTDEEYNMFILFFDYLYNPYFTWEEYCTKFEEYVSHIKINYGIIPSFAESKEIFLQFLYDTNIICYMEKMECETMFRWCYRERNFSRIAPKVKYNMQYRVHYGLYKSLNIGHQRKNQ